MSHRAGGKFIGNHSTVLERVGELTDYLSRFEEIDRIGLGFIKAHTDRSGGTTVLKIAAESPTCYLLKLTQKGGSQEVRAYLNTSDMEIQKRLFNQTLKPWAVKQGWIVNTPL